jgi:hypothetical protein
VANRCSSPWPTGARRLGRPPPGRPPPHRVDAWLPIAWPTAVWLPAVPRSYAERVPRLLSATNRSGRTRRTPEISLQVTTLQLPGDDLGHRTRPRPPGVDLVPLGPPDERNQTPLIDPSGWATQRRTSAERAGSARENTDACFATRRRSVLDSDMTRIRDVAVARKPNASRATLGAGRHFSSSLRRVSRADRGVRGRRAVGLPSCNRRGGVM